MTQSTQWTDLCSLSDLIANSGVCALFNDEQVALFYIPDEARVYAVGQYDPIGKANVMSRGIIGSTEQQLYVASPLYKQRFLLESGVCLDDETQQLPVWQTRISGARVEISPRT